MALTNREIKYLKSLNLKKYRIAERSFLAEGVRLLEETLKTNYKPLMVLYSPRQLSNRGFKVIEAFSGQKVEIKKITASESKRIAGTKSSPGIMAIFPFREFNLEQQLATKPRRILVCDRINDPGNLGTLMRSASAFEFDLIITTDGSAEITNPKTIRAGMGAYFRLPSVDGVSADLTQEKLTAAGFKIFCADIKGDSIEQLAALPPQVALVIGAEVSGLNPAFRNDFNQMLRIPMSKNIDSLNAAIAGSILMYWLKSNAGVP